MRRLVKNEIKTRISNFLSNLINKYLIENPQLTISDLIRDALTDYLTRDIQDRELTAINVQRLIKQVEKLDDIVKVSMELQGFYIQSWLVYMQEIPRELKAAAWKKAQIRYDKFVEGFKSNLLNNTNLIQKLLAGFIGEKNDPPDEEEKKEAARN